MLMMKQKEHSKEKQIRPNRTGLPDGLKTGIESLSGYSLDNVRVHYNSEKPSQFHAQAYTKGEEIHVAPGQEQCIPHEAWHVVQQLQGRVRPTGVVNNTAVNDDPVLEYEADRMGEKAAGIKTKSAEGFLFKRNIQSNSLQCYTKNGIFYQTIGEYYVSLKQDDRTREFLDKLCGILPQEIIMNVDISACGDGNAIIGRIKEAFKANWLLAARNLFDKYKDSMRVGMDLSRDDDRWVFSDDKGIVENFMGDYLNIFPLLFHHENLDRNQNPADPQNGIDIGDIGEGFDNGKSCVITALFKAEEAAVRREFHVQSVEQFHNVLVHGFNRNKYTDDTGSTEHQKNNVWKNYSDDEVYPSLYAHFGYIPQAGDPALEKHLNTAVRDRSLSGKRGMLSLEGEAGGDGHMIFFDLTGAQVVFFDNDVGYGAFHPNGNKIIKTVYCKRR